MSNISDCLAIVGRIDPLVSDRLLDRLDGYIAGGVASADAQRMAVADAMAAVEARIAAVQAAAREQHPDLYEKDEAPEGPQGLKHFSDPKLWSWREFGRDVDISFSSRVWSSALRDAVEAGPANAPAEQWRAFLRGLPAKGVKPDEIEWSGIGEWLTLQSGKVSRQAVLDYLGANGVRVEEVVLGGETALSDEQQARLDELEEKDSWGEDLDGDEHEEYLRLRNGRDAALQSAAKYGTYTLPGGQNYREVLLTLPDGKKQALSDRIVEINDEMAGKEGEEYRALWEERQRVFKEWEQASDDSFRSPHWDQPNVLAHIRLNDRVDSDGRRVLFVEELQGDWGQEGKKRGFGDPPNRFSVKDNNGSLRGDFATADEAQAYLDSPPEHMRDLFDRFATGRPPVVVEVSGGHGLPRAPFVTKTDAWVALALKRVIHMAATEGYDRVAFVTGKQSAERFSLDKHLSLIEFGKTGSDAYRVKAYDKNDGVVRNMPSEMSAAELERHLGKEIAEKIVAAGNGRLEGDGLKVEASGMRAFYDKIVPAVLKDVLRKVGGGQIGAVRMANPEKGRDVIAQQIPGSNLWGLWDNALGRWVDMDDNALSAPDNNLMSERAANSAASAINRDAARPDFTQPGFDITPSIREKVANGMPLFSERERLALVDYLGARQRGLRRVNSASVLEADIANAAKALDLVVSERGAGNLMNIEVPVGPVPHVLHMLGAPMQMMAVHASIVGKVLLGKHASKTSEHTSEAIIRGIYDPAMVLADPKEKGVFRVVTDLSSAEGPLTAVVMTDAAAPFSRQKIATVKSLYDRRISGEGDTLTRAILGGKVLYANMEKARRAIINARAQFRPPPAEGLSETSVPPRDTAEWKLIGPALADGIRKRSIKTDINLAAFIGDNFRPGPAGWEDAPSFSARTGRGSRFDLGKFGIGSIFVESIQDRYNRWKQAISAVRSQGGTITEANDFYLTEERYWGKVGARIDDFHDELKQFVKDVARDRLMLDDVATYAYALHAAERNAKIEAKRGPAPAGTGWSGMSTQDANDILHEAHASGLEPLLQRHAATLRSWIEGTRSIMLAEGLIDQDTFDALEQSYQHYVPLRGLPEKYAQAERQGTGQGFNIRGQESKRALGRKSGARQIIENIVQDRTRALIRSGKNEVGRSFLQFVLDNPDPDLWQVNEVRIKPVETVDAMGDRIIEERPVIVSDDSTITVKDGGREIRISVKDQRLREQLQNLHNDSLARPVAAMLWANRKLGQLYTSLSPVFMVLNGVRDLASATIGIIDELGFLAAPRLWAEMPRAVVESYMAEFGKYTQDYQLYRATGGKTGFFDFKTLDSQTAELRSLMDNADRSAIDPRVVLPKALQLIEKLNGGIENATRLASFKLARKSGRSVAEAASLAKNITVNFNRKGTMTPALSAWFLFFNPAVQGTTRVLKALTHPKVAATLGAGMLGIFGLALRNAAMGDDDDGVAWWDKIPDEIKERNLIIVLPPQVTSGEEIPGTKSGRFLKIPMPYGYNFFAVMANQVADVWRNSQDPRRGRKPTAAATKLFSAFMGSWIPVPELGKSFESSRTAVLAAVPDAANPIAQTLLNSNAFGREIYPSDRQSEHLPDASKTFPSQVGTLYDRAAKGLNRMFGGTNYESSSWLTDIAPGSLEVLLRGYGGGPAQFGLDIANAIYVRQAVRRDSVRVENLPFVKQLYGVIDAETDRMTGYDRLVEAEKKIAPYKRAVKDAEESSSAADDARALGDEWREIIKLGDDAKETRRQLGVVRDRELQALRSDSSDAAKYARLMELAERRRQVLQRFNRAYDKATALREERRQSGR